MNAVPVQGILSCPDSHQVLEFLLIFPPASSVRGILDKKNLFEKSDRIIFPSKIVFYSILWVELLN